ncbi:response regulator transcription factor [Luteolibacter pohnpeiensis]|uniref:Response regulator transcription factor n=1 Tax=Luteolibacter pohnpeiensis TaxID=454153 RepID=A0A934S3J3_9BACT|nr:response regulator transcription factor [Luteolibacter pohnpeiensis]MBK1881248.1 response regulator transcription factor [Luteolibacter pohnpeiensis]
MKLLVVEDNERLLKSLADYLQDEGFVVSCAADGEDGLHKATNWEYDLIILDVMLPVTDGWTILQHLRQSGSSTPVIMLTAKDQLADRLRGLNGGADDYLIKPFEMEELVARVRAALRRAAGSPSPLRTFGDVSLDTTNRIASLGGIPVDLSAREFALLEILASKHGNIVSRDYLYERLFDDEDESLSNMLDVYIYRLRSKLGKHKIQTRRGLGYIFQS